MPAEWASLTSVARPSWMPGPDPAGGWPKKTKAPTPAAASGVDAPRLAKSPETISSWLRRWLTGQLATSTQVGVGLGTGDGVGDGTSVGRGVAVVVGRASTDAHADGVDDATGARRSRSLAGPSTRTAPPVSISSTRPPAMTADERRWRLRYCNMDVRHRAQRFPVPLGFTFWPSSQSRVLAFTPPRRSGAFPELARSRHPRPCC